jgi:DNA mismatch repair protein MutL
MGARIKELPLDVVNQIAAGEVVERPASVIKELIENAIDAEANDIVVELVDAGKKQIIIKDNGCGIYSDDIELALTRHATSKIARSEDLFNIHTLGFRGEALPAIASVSKITVMSKSRESESGTKVYAEYGAVKSKQKKAIASGTIIIVNDIYSNTPARLKFLKKTSTELSHCISVVNNYAMAYPSVSFRVLHNGRSIFFLPSVDDMESRLSSVTGIKSKWLKAQSAYEHINGEVFVADPQKMDGTASEIKIFVNGRNVRDRMVTHAISSFYDQNVSSGDHPLTVIFLNIDPSFVDVNVSPTKNEVRFRESNTVYSFVQSLLEQALNTNKKPMQPSSFTYNRPGSAQTANTGALYQPLPTMTTEAGEQPLFEDMSQIPFSVIGQFHKQYVIIEEKEKLILIDQHAAHERINYERIKKALNDNIEEQSLLMPEILELGAKDAVVLKDILPELKKIGFNIEEFSAPKMNAAAFTIRSIPKILSNIDVKQLIRDIILEKAELSETKGIKEKIAVTAASLSCHASVRGIQQLHPQEIVRLLSELEQCEFPYTCPHGRPIKVEFTLYEIEKMFKRK